MGGGDDEEGNDAGENWDWDGDEDEGAEHDVTPG